MSGEPTAAQLAAEHADWADTLVRRLATWTPDDQSLVPVGIEAVARATLAIYYQRQAAADCQREVERLRAAITEYVAAMTDLGEHGLYRDPRRCVTAWDALAALAATELPALQEDE